MANIVLLVILFAAGTLIARAMIHSPYRPPVGMYIILLLVFALPLYFVFAFIPLIIVRRKTKHKPVAPPGYYKSHRDEPSLFDEIYDPKYHYLPWNTYNDDHP